MSKKQNTKNLSEKEIDNLVVQQADDDAAWDKPIRVKRAGSTTITLPSELAARAIFFARLHREATVDAWLKRVIQERIDIEEAAFASFKKELARENNC